VGTITQGIRTSIGLPVERVVALALGDRALIVRGNADRWTVEVYDVERASSG
jgi:hypothetical protein